MRLSYLVPGLLIAALLFVTVVTPATAQSGRIQGTVLDENGDSLAGAQVITEAAGRPSKDAVTNDAGQFAMIGFASGRVTVTVSLDGYATASSTVSVNQGNQAAVADFTLVRARSSFELLVGDAALEGSDPAELEGDLEAANAAFDAEDYDTAIAGYSELVATLPSLTTLHLSLGHAYRAKGEFEQALASYEKLAGDPEHADQADVEMARTRLAMGDLDAASELITAADASREDLYNLGEVDFAKGDIDSAAEWYEKAAAASPDWEKPWFKLALVALNKGDMDTAKQHFQKVVDLAPNSEEGTQAQTTLSALP